MTDSRARTVRIRAMQKRSVGNALYCAKRGLQMRESAKTIGVATERHGIAERSEGIAL